MKVLIAAGGTGGHIYPGIAVANELKRRDDETQILFVGTAKGLEKKIVPENGFDLVLIHSAGLKNVGVAGKIKGLGLLPKSFLEAWHVIREFRPHVVVGAGGYVSGPVLAMAHFMGYRTLVMDSNALPGFTNRKLARFVDQAALTFEAAKPFFGNKGVVTGNPVRKEFFEIKERVPGSVIHLLIFGGSQGAHAINEAMVEALPLLNESRETLMITHQTGEADLDRVTRAYAENMWADADVRPYIQNMVESFDAADLIICRAGATTCAEITAAGKAALLVPFPGAADDHQRKNAEALKSEGAARMILQSEMTGERLASEIQQLIVEPLQLVGMGAAARKMGRPDAAEVTVDMIEKLGK